MTLNLPTSRGLQLILCGSDEEAQAFKAAGLKSNRVITDPAQLYRVTETGYELDGPLGAFETIVLAYPLQVAQLRDDLAMRLGDQRCRWLKYPADHPNAAALAAAEGPVALANLVVTARPMWTDEVCVMSDVPDPTPEETFETGIYGLDNHGFRLVRPAFMPVIGPYGSGKSVLLRQLAVNLWKKYRWRTLLTSFEEKIKPRYQRDLRRHIIGKPIDDWTEYDVALADGQINQAFRFLRRPRGDVLNQQRLLNRIEYAVKVYGVDVVIIDPVNELDHEVPKHLSKTDYLGQFIMALKALADDYNLLMIVAAHPPKDGVEKRLSKGKLLTLNDGADTAHWGNKADIGWAVWRPDLDGPTLLHIDKLKDHETMGKPTLAELTIDPSLNQFSVTRTGFNILNPA
jgi:twinkle protein